MPANMSALVAGGTFVEHRLSGQQPQQQQQQHLNLHHLYPNLASDGGPGVSLIKPKKPRYSLYAERPGLEGLAIKKTPKPRKKEPEIRHPPPPPGRVLPMPGGYYITSTGKKSHKKLSYSVWNAAVVANGGKLGDGTPWPPPKEGKLIPAASAAAVSE